jgi:hypothetical protein
MNPSRNQHNNNTMTTASIEPIEAEFEIVPASLGLSVDAKHSLEIAFGGFFEQARKWKEQAAGITEPRLARTARLELKSIRVAAEKTRKELKEDSLRTGKAIDGANNILLSLIVPIEKQLEDVEKAAERAEAARIEALRAERIDTLAEFEHVPQGVNIGTMSEESWASYLQDAKDVFEVRKERERKAEAERVAKEKAEAEEKERIAAENARLKAEAEKREAEIKAEREAAAKKQAAIEAAARAEREKAEAERRAAEEAARKEREQIEAKAEAERKAADEVARKEREALEKKAEEERRARQKAEAEAQRIRNEEARRKQEEAAAEAKAARAPEREKVKAFASRVRELHVPELKSPEGQSAAIEIRKRVEGFAKWIEAQAETL